MLVFRSIYKYRQQIYEAPKRFSKNEIQINAEKQKARLMQEKLLQQTSNIESNTPRIVSILFGVMTVPTFYYFYNALSIRFEDISYFYNVRLCIDWLNLKYGLLCGSLIGLNMMKFDDFKAKNKLRSKVPINYTYYSLPILLGLCSYSCIETLSQWWVVPTLVNIISTMIAYSHSTNMGTAPFWTFAIVYQILVLDLITTGSLFWSQRNLNLHREKRKELYSKY
ncbi:unnamed protein product (macronuclear) [Paramecium tetraurelia]|uniref:Transmembrane protein n=1 Tax=Paramecium tetraurelia TaxID=5888 RepID=A0BHE8_PARTE|nr:uncharacterized protein GSPATT00029000001 [Paramecium tetraurelia]CAK57965.1 unnamed protein product [Paramecium tetraurelia]|eukprot:XP_001425363.1 hypothetical protein (macronuclear) [Paramecium tetraurelia strain d4-2]